MVFENILSNFVAYEDLNIDNDKIEKFCYKQMDDDPNGRIISNRGGWQSNDLFTSTTPELKELTDIISSRFIDLAFKMNYNINCPVGNFWININKKNSHNVPHIHPRTLLTSVYYVKVPENSGNIIFHRTIHNYEEYVKDYMISKYNEYNSSTYTFVPKKGKLLIFPSWLEHEVEPNETDLERISIAFNSVYE